jgi:hypothetical protein
MGFIFSYPFLGVLRGIQQHLVAQLWPLPVSNPYQMLSFLDSNPSRKQSGGLLHHNIRPSL